MDKLNWTRLSLLFVVLQLAFTTTFAQDDEGYDNRRHTITGHLLDADMKEPMVQATVQLFNATDSAFVGGSLSNTRGNFSVQAPSSGTFRLKISSVGFQTWEREVTLRRNENLDMGNIMIESESVMLKEAVVTGRAAQVIVKKDTILYNPEAYRTPEGSPIEELIKRIPGAEVDEDGNITINGKAVKKILLDGKEFMLGDVESALKNIPVSIIQNLKFYDQQSDQARITGIEDGEKETVLDFTIKKGMNRGFMTNLDLAGGTEHRYASRGMGSSFTDVMRFVLLGNFNNKEENAAWWNRRGLNARKMLGANMNYDDGDKLKIDLSLRWNHRDGDTQTENATENFYSETTHTFSNNYTKNMTRSNNWRANLRFEWKPDSLTNILLRANGTTGTDDGTMVSRAATYNDDPYKYAEQPLESFIPEITVNSNLNSSLSYGSNKNFWSMLQLYRRLNARGRNIVVRGELSGSKGESENASNNEVHLFQVKDRFGNDSTYYTARYNTTPTKSSGYVLATTYSEPLWKGAHLQFGYELRYNQNTSDRQTYDFSKMTQNPFAGVEPDYREWDPWLSSVYATMDNYLDMFGGKIDTENRYEKKWGSRDQQRRR